MPPRRAPCIESVGWPSASISAPISIDMLVMRFLISGRQTRMWCMRMPFSTPRQRRRAAALQHVPIPGMRFEELLLLDERLADAHAVVDVALPAVRDANVAAAQRNDARAARRRRRCPGPSNRAWSAPQWCARTRGPPRARELERVAVGEVGVCGLTAKTMELGFLMYCKHMARIWSSMSAGWSPTETLVMPGKSTSVRLRTDGEWIFSEMRLFEMPRLRPVTRSVRGRSRCGSRRNRRTSDRGDARTRPIRSSSSPRQRRGSPACGRAAGRAGGA